MTKSEQKSNENIIISNKQNLSNTKKKIHDKVLSNFKDSAQKRKKENFIKKLQMKKDLEHRIALEVILKNEYDTKINQYQEESINIVHRINTVNTEPITTTSYDSTPQKLNIK